MNIGLLYVLFNVCEISRDPGSRSHVTSALVIYFLKVMEPVNLMAFK